MVRRMNFAAARRLWKWPLLASAGIAGGIAALDRNEPVASVTAPAPAVARASSVDLPPSLPAREAVGRLRADPFAPRSWAPQPTPASVPVASVQPAPVPAEPIVPPNPFRFAGTVHHEGVLRVVLAAGERIHVVKGGEVLDDLYRVDAVSRNTVTLVYLPLGIEQQLAHAPDAPAAPGAGPVAAAAPSERP